MRALLSLMLATAAAAAQAAPRNVAIVVHDGVELLDFAGPGEVFEAAATRGGARGGEPWFRVFTVAPSKAPVVSQGFVRVMPAFSIEDCPKPDILVIPGGATARLTSDAAFMAWAKGAAADAEIVLTVCTGAFVLAHNGQLDGLSATTHHSALDRLRAFPKTTVKADERFVDNGRVVTAAGVSAGIDGSLHVIGRLLGRSAAKDTARYMEYDWRPGAAQLAAYSEWNPQLDARGQRLEAAAAMAEAGKFAEAAAALGALAKEFPEDGEVWFALGSATHRGGDFAASAKAHGKAAQFGHRRPVALYNQACAEARAGNREASLKALREAQKWGFGGQKTAANDADFSDLKDSPEFAAIVADIPE